MRTTLTIARRELAAFLLAPIAYIALVFFYVAFGLIFYLISQFGNFAASMEGPFFFVSLFLVLVIPLLTMRQIAEERRMGTMEGVMTAPVTNLSFVVGKFLGALGFYLILLVPSAVYSWFLFHYSTAGPDPWKLAAGYLGLVLMGVFMLSLGLLFSSVTRSQVVAALIGIITLFLFWLLGQAIPQTAPAPLTNTRWEQALRGLHQAGKFIAFKDHFDPFIKGIVALSDIIFFLSFTVFFLFLAVSVVASRKWR